MKILILAFLFASGLSTVAAGLPKMMYITAADPTPPARVNRDWAVLAVATVPTDAPVISTGAEQPKMLAPIVIQLSDVIRGWDSVNAFKLQTNDVVAFYFSSWPATETESSLLLAVRTKTLVRIMEGTNVVAEGNAQGFANRENSEGKNLCGLLLRVDSVHDAETAVDKIRHSAEVEWRQHIDGLDAEMRRRADDRERWLL